MVQITYRSAAAGEQTIDVESGNSLMEGGLFGCVPGIEGLCGGTVSCGTCHVHVPEPWFTRLGAPGESEADLLDGLERRAPNSRLACQIRVDEALEGLVVEVATS